MKTAKKHKEPPRDDALRSEPDLPFDLEDAGDLSEMFAQRDIRIAEARISKTDFANPEINSLILESCVLDAVAFSGGRIGVAKWKDIRLEDCDLANLEVRAMNATRVELRGCRMTGLRFGESDCRSLLVRKGDQRYAQFRFSVFRQSEFDGCDLEEADFYGADLRGCIFRSCNLRNVEMSKAKLEGADLRGSSVEGLRVGAEDIYGAIVDASQALGFAHLLGIRIL